MIDPQLEPISAERIAATSWANGPAPGLRTTSGASTAGSSQTPYMKACAGGNAANAVPVAAHSRFHAQKTTPKATPSTAVTTMSTVRQRRAGTASAERADDGPTDRAGLDCSRLPAPGMPGTG